MNMMTRISPIDPKDLPTRRRPRWPLWTKGAAVVAPVLLAGAGLSLAGKSDAPKSAPSVPVVTVAAPLARAIHEWDDFTGRFEPTETVEVRPRVSGQIVAVHFSDGQAVGKGQLLFTIDPRPFAAALAEARAGLASAHSELALAQSDLSRADRLLGDEAVALSEVDRLRARVLAGRAAVAAGQARVRARALDLEFTRIRAPIAGRVSDRRIDRGNLVGAGDGMTGTLLTTINALNPIHFSFDASEALFLKSKRVQDHAGAAPVEIRLQDEAGYRWRGRLDFTDNGLNPRSGTIRVRAVIKNPEGFLTAGMYGSARLSTGTSVNALLVPAAAVQVDQARKVVLVVGRDGSVAARPVTTGSLIGGLRVIRSGLSPRDRVVIAGIQMARPGSKVQVRTGQVSVGDAAPAPATTTPAAGQATFAAR